jgi:hypothetical protein
MSQTNSSQTYTIVRNLSPTNMCIIQYTERCIVITGSDTRDYQDTLRAIGGIFNPHLKCGAGWIFPKREEEKVVQSLISVLNPGSQCEMTYKPKQGSKCSDFLQQLDLHTSYSREHILELLEKAGYMYPSKFFRQISTKNSGGKFPHLLEETEQGWKLIHNCLQECSCCRDELQFSEDESEEESDVKNDPDYEDSEQESAEQESAEQESAEQESAEQESADYVSRTELNVANLRIRELQHQINELKKYVFKISTHPEEVEDNTVEELEESIEENENKKAKRCVRCVTM